MLPALFLAAALGSESPPRCWDVFDSAVRRSAAAAHPAYVSYDERISVTGDGEQVLYSTAHVDYRDDGTARVEDERFAFAPIVTRQAEPGPPELGPYGAERIAWLPQESLDGGFPVIAAVRAQGKIACDIADVETYKGHQAYHIVFRNTPRNRPGLKELWIDTQSRDIWKLRVTGYVLFVGSQEASPLTDFQVELEYAGPYLVVDHVVWQYRRREYSQYADYFGEYTLGGFSFPSTLPNSYFRQSGAQ